MTDNVGLFSPRSVLIVGPDSFGTVASVARAFEYMGWNAEIVGFRLGGVGRRSLRRRIATYTRSLREFETAVFQRSVAEAVVPRLESGPFSLVLFIKPYALNPGLLQRIERAGVPIVTWATDSLGRFADQYSLSDVAAHNFLMDGGDVAGDRDTWLPLGFDDSIFKPDAGEPMWDVLFVGNLFRYGYELRARFLRVLQGSRLGREYRVGFIGGVTSRILNRLGWLPGSVQWCAPQLPMAELGAAIARSRICVSVHQSDGARPVNPMFFAIPGCRTLMVTDSRQYLGDWLRPERDFIPVVEQDFVAVLERFLKNPAAADEVAKNGYRQAVKNTFTDRVRTMLSFVAKGSNTP